MRLPVIKHLTNFAIERDVDYLSETIDTLEALTELDNLKDNELDVIGELLSNLYGAIDVHEEMKKGKSQKNALNDFMKRVVSSID